MKKERPILFSTSMVQALLAGRKTQTRRILKMPKEGITDAKWGYTAFTPPGHVSFRGRHADGHYGESFVKCPYGQIGDILWVRETFITGLVMEDEMYKENESGDFIDHTWFRADAGLSRWFNGEEMVENIPWKPSIHMPKSAARIWLEITDIRVERVQEITSNDCIDEGIQNLRQSGLQLLENGPLYRDYHKPAQLFNDGVKPKRSFQTLWESINGTDSWESNPWVWAISFKVLSTTGRPDNNQ